MDLALDTTGRTSDRGARGAYLFFALACALTWLMDLPMVLALLGRMTPPPPHALLLTGLGALGPTLAALAIAGYRRELREVFGRWRTAPLWVVLGLLLTPALHLLATAIEVALGGEPASWFYPPVRPEHIAALVMFSLGEEFGWRGFAYPRLADRHGPVLGAILVGVVWSLWHFAMFFTADGPPSVGLMAVRTLQFSLASIVVAWLFERSGRSIAVAIAAHASGHLDNVHRAPLDEIRLWTLRLLVLAVAAGFAARALSAASAKGRRAA